MGRKLIGSKKPNRLQASFRPYQSEIGPLMDKLKLNISRAETPAAETRPVRYGCKLGEEADTSEAVENSDADNVKRAKPK